MCSTSAYVNGTPLTPLTGTSDKSYERLLGGNSGSCFDSGNNILDFVTRIPSDPQNLLSDFTLCNLLLSSPTDSPTPTSTETPTETGTPTATFTPSLTGTTTDTPTASLTGTVTSTPTPSPTSTFTPTATATATASSTPTASPTATTSLTPSMTFTPIAPTHIVISEFRSRGQDGSDDEFVELYNPTGATVNIGGWSIRRSASCGTTTYSLLTITSGTSLKPGQHYLAASTNFSLATLVPPDQTYSAALADDGGIALLNSSGAIIDQAGLCLSTYYREGTNLVPLTGNSNQSYWRKPGWGTSCYDTDNNAADFSWNPSADPQDLASPLLLCTGVLTSTPTFTPSVTPTRTMTRTRTPTRTATTYVSTVVMNEILPHPQTDWNDDGIINTQDEYIEIINLGTSTINLQNWKLDNGGGARYTLPNTPLLPKQIVVFFHSETGISLSDGGATVRLTSPDGRITDAFTYPIVAAPDVTWCRLPDGTGAWKFSCRPSPGRPNLSLNSSTPTPGFGTPTPTAPACPLSDTVPAEMAAAECNGAGGGITGASDEHPLWIKNRGKWEVFAE
ncbi:MAG TPA: lamin tail domain-containing protein [Anaerolineales bacterium]|nr:lamin tail domain-containing protein [Anaerolineales bacterium]